MATKDFNAMLHKKKDMPKIITITDEGVIQRYGGEKMLIAAPLEYDEIMRQIPFGKLLTTELIRQYLAVKHNANFTEPKTAGIFISLAAQASNQRETDKTPYWRVIKTKGDLNDKYPGGVEEHKRLLESEGHTIIQKRKNYYVANYQNSLYKL